MEIPGYILSNNYKKLWELIKNGYLIPAWIEKSEQKRIVQVSFNDGYYYIGTIGVGYCGEQNENGFFVVCKSYNLHYIEPKK